MRRRPPHRGSSPGAPSFEGSMSNTLPLDISFPIIDEYCQMIYMKPWYMSRQACQWGPDLRLHCRGWPALVSPGFSERRAGMLLALLHTTWLLFSGVPVVGEFEILRARSPSASLGAGSRSAGESAELRDDAL